MTARGRQKAKRGPDWVISFGARWQFSENGPSKKAFCRTLNFENVRGTKQDITYKMKKAWRDR